MYNVNTCETFAQKYVFTFIYENEFYDVPK